MELAVDLADAWAVGIPEDVRKANAERAKAEAAFSQLLWCSVMFPGGGALPPPSPRCRRSTGRYGGRTLLRPWLAKTATETNPKQASIEGMRGILLDASVIGVDLDILLVNEVFGLSHSDTVPA